MSAHEPETELQVAAQFSQEAAASVSSVPQSFAALVQFLRGLPVAAITIDTDGAVTSWNHAAEQVFGWSEEEVRGESLPIVPDDRRTEHDEYRAKILDGEPFADVETSRLRKDGSSVLVRLATARLVDTEGVPVGILGLFADIGPLKEAEADLRKLSQAIEQAAEAVVITDPQGTIDYVNPAFERITGYSADEAIGDNPRMLKSGEHDENFYRNMWNAITAGETWKGTFINRRKDGSLYHEETTISPVRNEDGELASFIAVKRNITREVELEEQIRRAQRLEAVGRLAGGVAHDFNNLLTAIHGYVEFMSASVDPDASEWKDLQQIRTAVDKAGLLTQQLLAFSRRQPLARKVLVGNELVRETLELTRGMLPSSIDLTVELDPEAGNVRVDPTQIEQVIVNLVVNARDALSGRGQIRVKTRSERAELPVETATSGDRLPGGFYFVVSVADDGEGMDEEVREQVFDPFFTTKEQGTGLGLSTCYGIVRQHGGKIRVDSAPGEGTTFEVFLPQAEGEPDELELDEEMLADRTVFADANVLIVDDDLAVRSVAVRVLEKQGFNVFETGKPHVALELVGKDECSIDLLVTDLVMPGLDGIELASRFRELCPRAKVLYISGHSDRERPELPEGARYLRKPFGPDELVQAAHKALWSD